jgi:hypothetical protein
MNLKKNYGSNPGMEVRPTLIDKAKGIRNFNLYMKKGATIMDKSLISKNPKSLSINEKLSYNPKVLNESLLKYKPIETRNDSKINPSETSFTNNNIDIKISVNYLKQNNFKDSHKLKEDNNNSSLSNILIKDMQNKENMLKNLKTAITEDKNIRKKFYSNEKDLNNITILPNNEIKQIHKRNPTSNQEIIQNNLNISLLTYENKPNIQNQYNNTTTHKMSGSINNEIPTQSFYTTYKNNKPYIDNSNYLRNSHTLNNLHNKERINDSTVQLLTQQDQSVNSSTNLFNNININAGSSSSLMKENLVKKVSYEKETYNRLQNLEKKLDDTLQGFDPSLTGELTSLTKKFTIYKKCLEEYNHILYPNEGLSLTSKVSSGFNEIVKTILHQYSSVLEKLTSFGNISKKLVETNKIIEEKNNEILQLRAKLGESEKSKSKSKLEVYTVENTTKFMIKPSQSHKKVDNSQSNQPKPKESASSSNGNNNTNINNLNVSYVLPIETSEHNKIISGNFIIKQK